MEDSDGPGVSNCDVGRGLSVGLDAGGVILSLGEMGLGIVIACWRGLLRLGLRLVEVSCLFLDFRRDGVKNKRLFWSFLGVSPSLWTSVGEGIGSVSLATGVSTALSPEERLETAADGGVELSVDSPSDGV